MKNKGRLEIIWGSMFSGKSEEIIRRLRRAEFAKQKTMAFKHSLDMRKTIKHVISHNGTKIHAFAISNSQEILELLTETINVIGIDEIQFFDQNIVNIIIKLVENGKRVIAAGLDLDFRGIP